MARIKINFPDTHLFSTEIKVRITDLNYGNHLGNDSLLSLLHEARVRFFREYGYTELNVEGVGIIMADVAIQYVSEAFYGERLKIDIAAGDFSRVAFDMFYRVTSGERVVAVAKTGIVFYDYTSKKVAAVPAQFVRKISH